MRSMVVSGAVFEAKLESLLSHSTRYPKRIMNTKHRAVSLLLLSALIAMPAMAQTDSPYGSARFESYSDINSIQQLKAVWDFNFSDPKAVGMVFNNVAALMKATSEYGPNEMDPLKIVIVSHGPEIVVWAKKNYTKYKDIVDRAASLTKQGIRIEICNNAAKAQGFKPEDLQGFVTVVPAGPYALAFWQAKGYSLNAIGATMPTAPITDANRGDIAGKP